MVVDYELKLMISAPIVNSKGEVVLIAKLIAYKDNEDNISLIKKIAEEL